MYKLSSTRPYVLAELTSAAAHALLVLSEAPYLPDAVTYWAEIVEMQARIYSE